MAAAGEDQWITPPAAFLASNYVRSPAAPVRTHDIILEVPPSSAGKAKPIIVRSCGDADLDRVAMRFVSIVMERSKKMQARGTGAALRFQIRLAPARLDPKDLPKRFQRPSNQVDPNRRIDLPPFSRLVFASQNVDDIKPGSLRLRIPAAGGIPDEAVVVQSTGSERVDSAVLFYGLSNARGRSDARSYEVIMPVAFGRSLAPSEFIEPDNFPTNERTIRLSR